MTTIYVDKSKGLPERKSFDEYKTEHTLIRAALDAYRWELSYLRDRPNILDPGAGDGRWGMECRELWPWAGIVGVELQDYSQPEDYDRWFPNRDYMDWAEKYGKAMRDWAEVLPFDLVIGNPPYNKAQEFVAASWNILREGGIILFLLRLSFQAGVRRAREFWPKYPLSDVGILAKRPSFYGGGTNGTDYGLFLWIKGLGYPKGGWPTRIVIHEREKCTVENS